MEFGEHLQHRKITMLESLPEDFEFLEHYQQYAWSQIQWDQPSKQTIEGKNPVHRMYDGIHEELDEIIGDDKVEPNYNRLGALMLFNEGMVTPTAVARHLKEFGDTSWYLANMLTLFDIDFKRTIDPGMLAWKLNNISQPRATETDCLEQESEKPWINYLGYRQRLLKAVDGITCHINDLVYKKPRNERLDDEQELIIATGLFTLGAVHILTSRFNTSYQAVLLQNNAKIDKRIKDGTVFDKSKGEDR